MNAPTHEDTTTLADVFWELVSKLVADNVRLREELVGVKKLAGDLAGKVIDLKAAKGSVEFDLVMARKEAEILRVEMGTMRMQLDMERERAACEAERELTVWGPMS